ncbi:hypothetical protein VNO77_08997 [Canavalia gladiata]|uniref:Uncharacterized protein n=1 Tax=Canavalia gladiata TaxID=3824 RepID=A0AAN9QWD4_CANGL
MGATRSCDFLILFLALEALQLGGRKRFLAECFLMSHRHPRAWIGDEYWKKRMGKAIRGTDLKLAYECTSHQAKFPFEIYMGDWKRITCIQVPSRPREIEIQNDIFNEKSREDSEENLPWML